MIEALLTMCQWSRGVSSAEHPESTKTLVATTGRELAADCSPVAA